MIKIKVCKRLPKRVSAMAIFPYILIKRDAYRNIPKLMVHESIHIEQQKELLWLPFFILYFLEYLFRLIQYRNSHQAYKNISFEREAYTNQSDEWYLNERKPFAFIKYYITKNK
jgi:hypothetical protein